MIRVLLVDDSEVSLMVLRNILEKEQDIDIVGSARYGKEAISLVSRLMPDIITMDINMPGEDGFVTTRKIMESNPVPIIIVSGIDNLESIHASFKAIEAGALTVIRKPPALQDPEFFKSASELVSAIRTYSEVKVIRRRNLEVKKPDLSSGIKGIPRENQVIEAAISICKSIKLIVIGASTGGPQVIQEILAGVPDDYPIPIVIVQHMSPGFIEGFSQWLKETTHKKTRIPDNSEHLNPGIVYLAPDGKQTGITVDFCIELSDSPREHNLRPSVSYLFRSTSENCAESTLAILLTGMGSDGAREMLQLRKNGGCTIIQDRESSFVYGMPGVAKSLDAGMFSLSPKEITLILKKLAEKI